LLENDECEKDKIIEDKEKEIEDLLTKIDLIKEENQKLKERILTDSPKSEEKESEEEEKEEK